jgi:GTP cyclohydrolase I
MPWFYEISTFGPNGETIMPRVSWMPPEPDVRIHSVVEITEAQARDISLRDLQALYGHKVKQPGVTVIDGSQDWTPLKSKAPQGPKENLTAAASLILKSAEPETHGRGGLLETPDRFAKAWQFWTSGYSESAADILKVFEDGGEDYDEMVLVKDIPLYSKCEHHLADIFGTASVAYIPNGRIVGLSKLSRLVDMHARRLQVQERLTRDIASDLWENLNPIGVGVVVKARHMCMESRGICQQGHHTVTCALHGVMKTQPATRAEFMAWANS